MSRWQVFVLAHVTGRAIGVWEPIGRAWWSYRDASLWKGEMRHAGAGTDFEIQEEQPTADPNFVKRVA